MAPRQQEGMVACDCCDKWFHYTCVGVTDAVKKEKRWYCDDIACQLAAKEYQKQKGKKVTVRKTFLPMSIKIWSSRMFPALDHPLAVQLFR